MACLKRGIGGILYNLDFVQNWKQNKYLPIVNSYELIFVLKKLDHSGLFFLYFRRFGTVFNTIDKKQINYRWLDSNYGYLRHNQCPTMDFRFSSFSIYYEAFMVTPPTAKLKLKNVAAMDENFRVKVRAKGSIRYNVWGDLKAWWDCALRYP